jgi:hypothetical protein
MPAFVALRANLSDKNVVVLKEMRLGHHASMVLIGYQSVPRTHAVDALGMCGILSGCAGPFRRSAKGVSSWAVWAPILHVLFSEGVSHARESNHRTRPP